MSKNDLKVYDHPGRQPGWKNNSPKPGYAKDQISDEEFAQTLDEHNTLWRYIVTRYPHEDISPVLVIGYDALPIGIELSQWTYPVTFISSNESTIERARRDTDIHAAENMEIFSTDFLNNVPQARVIVFLELLDQLEGDVVEYFELLLRRCGEVVSATHFPIQTRDKFEDAFDVKIIPYDENNLFLVSLRENEKEFAIT